MARKKPEEEHENHERWLVSYADLMTLMFAFFVVMYAISSVNVGKYRILSDSLGAAFGNMGVSPKTPPTIEQRSAIPERTLAIAAQKQRSHEAALHREKDRLTSVARDILKALEPLVAQGKVRVTQSNLGVNVEINASVLFAPGDAKLNKESGKALAAVAKVLKNDNHSIQVEGHTDNVPIRNASFPSNWELSAVRASSVVRLFLENGVTENRMVAVGHGSNQPVGSNDTVEGRLRNRRVAVMILSDLPESVTEVPVSTADAQ
jgi:chemotaxis protein MotB